MPSMKKIFSLLATATLLAVTNTSLSSQNQQASPIQQADHSTSQPWQTLPPTPQLPKIDNSSYAQVNGINMWYATYGEGSPVVLIHESYGNANYWGELVTALAPYYKVIVMDLRGNGRSSMGDKPLSLGLMASDIIALMDNLKIDSAAIVGWGDGANIGINIAINHPDRVNKLFAFAGNISPASSAEAVYQSNGFPDYLERTKQEYLTLSPTPTQEAYNNLVTQISHMWITEPNTTIEQLESIETTTLIADGDHDGSIQFGSDTITMANTIPDAGLLIEPFVSHFSPLENPEQFNEDVLRFLAYEKN